MADEESEEEAESSRGHAREGQTHAMEGQNSEASGREVRQRVPQVMTNFDKVYIERILYIENAFYLERTRSMSHGQFRSCTDSQSQHMLTV